MNMLALNTPKADYWSKFYSNSEFGRDFHVPSQFGAFSLTEMRSSNINQIIEIGCGNGRDTMLFIQHGLQVVATDKSEAAIERIQEKLAAQKNLKSFVFDITSQSTINRPSDKGALAIYARFVLHALTDEQICNFFKFCFSSTRAGDKVFVEYRTREDQTRQKEFSNHYRNFLDPGEIENVGNFHGLKVEYQTSGTGLAKFRDDDAHVARQIFVREV